MSLIALLCNCFYGCEQIVSYFFFHNKQQVGHLWSGERKETILEKLQGSANGAAAEVEALSGNLPAETVIVIGKSAVRGKGRVEAGREMIMIERNPGREDGPDECICACGHKFRGAVAFSFLSRNLHLSILSFWMARIACGPSMARGSMVLSC